MNKITIVGIGKLGLCVSLFLESKGYKILGIDLNQDYINSINNKTLKSFEPEVERFLSKSKNLSATIDLKQGLEFSDYIFIYVPTPTKKGETNYDDTYLSELLQKINKEKIKNKTLLICCTIIPGYIRDKAYNLISDCKNINIVYNPEFIAQGNIMHDLENPDITLLGMEKKDFLLEDFYKKLCPKSKLCVMTTTEAEITKLAINCYITSKICFANLIGDIADKSKCSADIILEAVGKDSRIGNKCLKYGYGYGGPCFPRDNRALDYYSNLIGVKNVFSGAVDYSNSLHLDYQYEKIKNVDTNYIFENVCYKENCKVPIIEESQKLLLAEKLALNNHTVTIYDYKNILDAVKDKYKDLFLYKYKND